MARYTRRHSVLAPTALALIAGTALSFVAQGQSWNGGNGNWFTATNWTPNTAPNSTGAAVTIGAAGTYTVTLDASTTIGTLNLSNANATLLINPSLALNTSGNIANNGTIRINNGTNQTTQIALNTNLAFTGTGRVIMNANAANIDTARFVRNIGGVGVTNNAGHTISGSGQFNDCPLTNAGTLDADLAGGGIQLVFNAHGNTGVMRSSVGFLNFNQVSVNNAGGTISAVGTGTTNFISSTITGGTVTTAGSGVLQVPASNNSRFTNVTNTGTITVANNSTLFIDGTGITNNGTITVNPGGVNQTTSLTIGSGDKLFSGNGSIRLNANSANIDTARFAREAADSSVTFGPGQTVTGTGQFNDIGVTNNGTIGANVNGATLQLVFRQTANNSLMAATNGGNLQINQHVVTNSASGQVVADGAGSTVSLLSGTINGGSVIAQNGGLVLVPAGNSGYFGTLTQSGPLAVFNSSVLFYNTAMSTINGTITVNPGGVNQTTSIGCNLDANVTLSGSGTIVLNANEANIDTARLYRAAGNNSAFTFGPNLTIRGTGQLNDIGVTNNGIIQADVAGKTLQSVFRGTNNNNIMQAINGANLQFNQHTVNNGVSGVVRAVGANSTVSLISSAINGGTVTATTGGLVQLPPSTSASFGALTQSGPMSIFNNATLLMNAATGTTINGTITVNPAAIANTTSIGCNLDGNVTLGGSGTIVLNANDANIDTARLYRAAGNNSAFTFGPNLTIRGTGQLNDIGVTNNGIIQADVAGKTLQSVFRGTNNNNIMQAINGANLQFNQHTVNNGASGVVQAVGAGSTVTLISSAINGGAVTASGGGLVQVASSNNGAFGAVTQSGPMSILNNATLFMNAATGTTINGTITVNPAAIANTTSIGCGVDGNVTLGGNGTIVLNANSGNIDTARFYRQGGNNSAFTFGPNLTIRGTGQFNDIATTLQGTLSPGDATNTGLISSTFRPLSFAGTSRYNARIGKSGPTLFNDTISSNATVNLAGNCTVTFSGAYTPVSGEGWNIITCANRVGKFNSINLPVIALPKVLKLSYLSNGVRVSVACNSADITGLGGSGGPDGNLTSDDVVAFLAGFFANDLAVADVASLGGNLVPDGQLTADDIVAFLAAFFRGCQ